MNNFNRKTPLTGYKPGYSIWLDTSLFLTMGLGAGIVSGEAAFNSSDKPLFNEAFIDTIYFNPFSVKCFLFLTR